MRKHFGLAALLALGLSAGFAQGSVFPSLTTVKNNPATPVKNQGLSGTCWSFSTTSLVESMSLAKGVQDVDISEMFTVRNIYMEKAKNYILRQGAAQFGEGGLGHDVIRAISLYGAMPETAYSGLPASKKMHDHIALQAQLKNYLDSILKKRPLATTWLEGYVSILDNQLGAPPAQFEYKGKTYTARTYADEVLKFNADDYVNITSFTHHPYYQPFILEAPDNFSNGAYYNLPLDEMIEVVKQAITKGYTVMWDADVSNRQFSQNTGYAMLATGNATDADAAEESYTTEQRQALYENLTTQDDHLMHLTGINTSAKGKTFFIVKNSWGNVGPFQGYINVSVPYFAINTVSLVVPKAALSKEQLKKLSIK
jgi:bleomycin hydrolase